MIGFHSACSLDGSDDEDSRAYAKKESQAARPGLYNGILRGGNVGSIQDHSDQVIVESYLLPAQGIQKHRVTTEEAPQSAYQCGG